MNTAFDRLTCLIHSFPHYPRYPQRSYSSISLEETAARLRVRSDGLLPPRPTAYSLIFFLTPENTRGSVYENEHHNL